MTELETSPSTVDDQLRERLAARLARARRSPGAQRITRRADPGGPSPLSPAQARMWFAAEYEPESPAYNVPVALRMRGQLDVAALCAAVTDVAARHEVLRSVVELREGVPFAVPEPPQRISVQVCDLTVEPLPERTLRGRLAEQAERPFALGAQCPTRAAIYRLAGDDHVLALTFHHIAVDAWSLRLVLADVAACYAARTGAAGPPAPPTLQYADVIACTESTVDAVRLDWWRDRLAGLPAVLSLPTDRPRPVVTDSAGDRVSLVLPAVVADRVRQVGAATGATVFMVLMSAWQVLLGRLAGVDDLAVGVISAGRRHADTEAVVGCFVDTIAVRADLSGAPTGRQVLARVRATVLDALAHADVPLEAVLDATAAARVPGAHPLFQVLLNVYDNPLDTIAFPGLRAESIELETPTAKFDLSLNMMEAGAGQSLRGWLGYRTALFDEATIERMVTWYATLLDGLLADLDRPIADLPLAAVHGPLLAGPRRDYPTDVPLHALIERWVADCPQSTAVVGPDGSLSYAELDRRAHRLASRLHAAGVTADEPVAVQVERGTEIAVGLLGVLKAGAAYLPIDPGYPPARVQAMLAAAGCRILLTTPIADGDEDAPVPATGDAPPPAAGDAALPAAEGGERLAYVIFTSGSTGTPKGVAVEHRSIVHYLHAVLDRLGPHASSGRSFALASTAAADLGLTCVLGALTTGGTLHVVDRETSLDPQALGSYLDRHGVDVLKLVPSHLRLLGTHGELARVLPRRVLIVAGEACPWELVAQVRAARPDLAVQSHYGPTETTVAVMVCDVDEIPPERWHGTVPLGRPLAGAELYTVDAWQRPLPPGATGELVIGGPGVARGYLGRDDLTTQRFGPNPVTGEGRCYRTGDRVRIEADGTVAFLGRTDDQLKIRGYRVEPGEVVAACRAVPGVADAVVLPAGDERRPHLAAWLVPKPGVELDVATILEALRTDLPDHLVPSALVTLEALPLNANGKVDRAALPAPAVAAPAELTTETQRRIAQVWRELLDVTEIGADDDFFALGGDSFTAVRAVRAIDPRLRVIDLFTHRTVAALASYLDASVERGGGLLHRLAGPPPGRAAGLTAVCVPYGGGSAAALRPLAEALAEARGDVAVFAVELPGHDAGRPDEPTMPLDDLVDRCAAELALLPGPFLVYGHCVGTAAALALTLRLASDGRDVVGVVLAASFPTARLPGRLSAWFHRLMPTDRWQSDRAYRDILTVMGGLADAPDDPATSATILRALRHDAREAEAWFSRVLADPDRPRLRAPILSVVGERDRTTELYGERYREWTAFGQRVELATIPRAGHYFLKHQAGELARLVSDRLATWTAGPAPAAAAAFTSADEPIADTATRRGLNAFRVLAAGQFTSMVGSQLSAFAMGVWVYQRTGRLFDFAMLTMLALVPAVLAAPIGGALTDRFDRRRVMLFADLAAALAVGGLALQLWLGGLQMWHILVVVTVGSLATAVQRPAYLAAVAQLVPKPYLPQANALANLGTGVGTLLGPLAGGVLITSLGLSGVVALDVATFLIAVATLLAIRFPDRLFRRRDERFAKALAGGWRFIARRRSLVVMIAFYIPVNYLLAVAMVLVTPLTLSVASPVTLGVVTAAGGLGAAVGALAMVAWGGTKRLAHGMIGFTIGVGIGTALMGVVPVPSGIAAGLFLFWACVSVLNAHWIAIIQVKVGQDLQGRVLAVNQMLATAMMPLGFVTAPALADRLVAPVVGDRAMAVLLVLAGLLLVAWSVAGLVYRPLRRMEDDLPDAVAGPEIAEDLDEVQRELDARSLR